MKILCCWLLSHAARSIGKRDVRNLFLNQRVNEKKNRRSSFFPYVFHKAHSNSIHLMDSFIPSRWSLWWCPLRYVSLVVCTTKPNHQFEASPRTSEEDVVGTSRWGDASVLGPAGLSPISSFTASSLRIQTSMEEVSTTAVAPSLVLVEALA